MPQPFLIGRQLALRQRTGSSKPRHPLQRQPAEERGGPAGQWKRATRPHALCHAQRRTRRHDDGQDHFETRIASLCNVRKTKEVQPDRRYYGLPVSEDRHGAPDARRRSSQHESKGENRREYLNNMARHGVANEPDQDQRCRKACHAPRDKPGVAHDPPMRTGTIHTACKQSPSFPDQRQMAGRPNV